MCVGCVCVCVCERAWQNVSSVPVKWRSELSSGHNWHTVATMCRLIESKKKKQYDVANTIQCSLSGVCLTRAKWSIQKSSIMIQRRLQTHLLSVEQQCSKQTVQTWGTSLDIYYYVTYLHNFQGGYFKGTSSNKHNSSHISSSWEHLLFKSFICLNWDPLAFSLTSGSRSYSRRLFPGQSV